MVDMVSIFNLNTIMYYIKNAGAKTKYKVDEKQSAVNITLLFSRLKCFIVILSTFFSEIMTAC